MTVDTRLLKLIEENARLSVAQLAMMTGKTEQEVEKEIDEYSRAGIIRGYKAVIDWEKAGREFIQAFIQIKVSPSANAGFNEIAAKLMTMPEVQSVYLVSGNNDFSLTMTAPTLREVANFVSERLSPLVSVLSTDTQFVLQRYKELGVNFSVEEDDGERREFLL
ncbi:MAG: Lrp/AsnC family transcriptional regulator [Clostridia bacterium]|nr:Lrp/AsnC family transcriptional regulator [Clostridia bacterium]